MTTFSTILKWDRNQPRGPKGSRQGGRWVKGVSAGAHSAESFSEVPGMERDRSASYVDALIEASTPPSGVALNVRAGQLAFGEQVFQNNPRAIGQPRVEAALARATAGEEDNEAARQAAEARGETPLSHGVVAGVRDKFNGGVNASYLVIMAHSEDDPDGVKAVYKPESGERWGSGFTNNDIDDLIANRKFSLAEREAMAYEVSEALGFHNLVPETRLRTELKVEGLNEFPDDDENYYDSQDARDQYEQYRENRQEQLIDEVGGQMYGLYQEAQQEHFEDIERRVEEVQEIWDEEKEKFPHETPYGTESALREHPVLPMGSQPFERKEMLDPVDPLELLADADVTAPLNNKEKDAIRLSIREALEAGHRDLGELDEKAAKEHLDYDDWRYGHEDTENRLYESGMQSFTEWRRKNGIGGQGSAGRSSAQNPHAPHPNGGSVQLFVHDMEDDGDLSFEDATKMAVLDYVIGSMDRHGGNMKFRRNEDASSSEGDYPVAIDNGYSMPEASDADNFHFRSVAVAEWMAKESHHQLAESLRLPILRKLEQTDWEALADMHPNMNAAERESFLGRVAKMKAALEYDEGLSTLWHDQRLMRF